MVMIDDMQGKIVTAFINSKGEIEYTEYKAVDGGVMELPAYDNVDSVNAYIASELGIQEYQDFKLEEIPNG